MAIICGLAGIFFGIAFPIAMVILEWMITLIFTGSFFEAVNSVMETPWWAVGLGGGGGFGILFFVILFIMGKVRGDF